MHFARGLCAALEGKKMNASSCIDSTGRTIEVGVDAKILTIPAWLTHDLPDDEVARLKTTEGTIMRVLEIDPHGYVWFGTNNSGRWFCLRPNEVQVIFDTAL
jgi:hypothetical protein